MHLRQPLHIYTDGAAFKEDRRCAYGWLLANPEHLLTPARVVSVDYAELGAPRCAASSLMEAEAVTDALCEFRYRDRPLVVHTDSLSLVEVIQSYRDGSRSGDYFLQTPTSIRPATGRRLLAALDKGDARVEWVKAHGVSYHNRVIDQALRHACKGMGEREAAGFAATAVAEGRARVWDSWHTAEGWASTWKSISLETFGRSEALHA